MIGVDSKVLVVVKLNIHIHCADKLRVHQLQNALRGGIVLFYYVQMERD